MPKHKHKQKCVIENKDAKLRSRGKQIRVPLIRNKALVNPTTKLLLFSILLCC